MPRRKLKGQKTTLAKTQAQYLAEYPMTPEEAFKFKYKRGDHVTYTMDNGKVEKGIVKECNKDIAHVVYKCADEWEKFYNYTAQATKIDCLSRGWPRIKFKLGK